jgi:muramoyltetrapeptide carboxypeptidase
VAASRKPPALKKGDTIGIMAPSSRVSRKLIAKAVAELKDMGFRVYVHPQTYARRGQSAGTAQQKADALHDLYRNPDIKAVFAAAGGNQAGAVLDRLDYALMKKHPKIIMGYSDVTVILNAIHKKTGAITFHGPTVQTIARKLPAAQLKQAFNLLGGEEAEMPLGKSKVIHGGTAHGKLVGGNLSLIVSLLGTPWQPDFKNSVLFLEDCTEELSRIDRMLRQLRNAGAFDQISGLVLGGFTDLTDKGGKPYGKTVEAMIREVTAGLDIPVVMNAPFGHGRDLYSLPVGLPARLTARAGHSRLALDGPAVKL